MPKGLTLEEARSKAAAFTASKQRKPRGKMPDMNDAFDEAMNSSAAQGRRIAGQAPSKPAGGSVGLEEVGP